MGLVFLDIGLSDCQATTIARSRKPPFQFWDWDSDLVLTPGIINFLSQMLCCLLDCLNTMLTWPVEKMHAMQPT